MAEAKYVPDTDKDIREPAVEYRDDPKDEMGGLLIQLDCIGLKKVFMKDKPKNLHREPVIRLDGRRLEVFVEIKPKKSGDKVIVYEYRVYKLLDEVEQGPVSYKVKHDDVLEIRLRKKTPKLWNEDLRVLGLDLGEK